MELLTTIGSRCSRLAALAGILTGCSLALDLPSLEPCESRAQCDTGMECVDGWCVSSDERATTCDDANCADVATCDDSTGVAECSCPVGFTDDFGDGTSCTDIDECQGDAPPACDEHASCVNTPGAAHCECNLGYHGNGLECVQNVPCDSGCHALATCESIAGADVCVCASGYEGDGASCADVDECALNTDGCDSVPDACVNDAGSYSCSCPAGYDGNGEGESGCTDVNECAGTNDCDGDPDACVNNTGSYTCSCPGGYSGDGIGDDGCTDINECAGTNDCDDDPDACVNNTGGYTCSCPGGYSGDGIGAAGCTDINECAGTTECDDEPDACVNNPGSYSCSCPGGYSGDGVGDDGCTDINECAGSNDCDANADCLNTPGSYSCICGCGYAGPGTSCSPSQIYLGNGPPGFSSYLAVPANLATAYKITVPTDTRLLNFGVVSRSSGPSVRFGLYTDNGQPDSLLIETPAAGVTLSVGTVTALSTSPCLDLVAGSYWLVVVGNPAFDLAADADGSSPTVYWTHTFGSPLPNAPTVSTTSGRPYSAFIVVD